MQTSLPKNFLSTNKGKRADDILRSCVHCGFCTATCPTYLITGNELDSPRGRIYLMKEMFEQGQASTVTRAHLDRCLSCQSCETTCPSDVQYHDLLNIGNEVLDELVPENPLSRLRRTFLLAILGSKKGFAFLVRAGLLIRFLLPRSLVNQLPAETDKQLYKTDTSGFNRKVILLAGCVQSALSPATNKAATRVFNTLGIGTIEISGGICCGAMHYHSRSQKAGMSRARELVFELEEGLAQGAEAFISTASGCGNFIKSYQEIFHEDAQMLSRLKKIAGKVFDISEFLQGEDLSQLHLTPISEKLVYHSPCTMQHGQKLTGTVEGLLQQLGFPLDPVKDSHLCCGSAGTYSLFQPDMAGILKENKLIALEAHAPGTILTANIGCQCHLASGTQTPVRHWIELVAELMGEEPSQ